MERSWNRSNPSFGSRVLWQRFYLTSQQWVEAVDELDKKGFLLGQNEQVRGNHIHITQHWVNDLYATPMVGVKNFMDPIERVYGELNNPIHVL